MKQTSFLFSILLIVTCLLAQNPEIIELSPPDKGKGLPLMQALSQRASVREFDTTALSMRDLSDMLWAANGINRPDEGKRTAASALNAQDIDVYVAMESAIYLYEAQKHVLEPVVAGDYRNLIAGRQENFARAPVIFLLVSDISRFRAGEEAQKLEWAAIDAGIVAQNILLYCASENMAARPRASMDKPGLREMLRLSESQFLILNIPVSYMAD